MPGHGETRVRYNNAIQIYDMLASKAEMMSASTLAEFGYPAKAGEEVLVYRGYSTKETETLGLLKSSAHHAMALLKAMRAITLLRQGTKSSTSVYVLHYKPTDKQYEDFIGYSERLERKYTPNLYDQLVNQIAHLTNWLDKQSSDLADTRDLLIAVRSAAVGLEKRISELERRFPLA